MLNVVNDYILGPKDFRALWIYSIHLIFNPYKKKKFR